MTDDPMLPLPTARATSGTSVTLLWIPLGAGQPIVTTSGRIYERLHARRERRAPMALFHAALEITFPAVRYAVELAPVPDRDGSTRGVVAGGPVGSRILGRWRWFRYELRCWPDRPIPDRHLAVPHPLQLTDDPTRTRAVLAALPRTPTPVWGRDELRLGEMWNSNSVIAWLLATTGAWSQPAGPPPGGRAPGWEAGLRLAARGGHRPAAPLEPEAGVG